MSIPLLLSVAAAMLRILVFLIVCALPAVSVAIEASGRVFIDRNGNGVLDSGEPGLAGAKVSNGRDIALTDAHGSYRIVIAENDTVFVIKPPGTAFPKGEHGLPRFWRHHRTANNPALRYGGMTVSDARRIDFPLDAAAGIEGEPLEVLVFGDPQPKSLIDVDFYARDIVEPIIGKHPARFGLSLGDIAHDDLSLYPALNRVTSRLGVPWLHAAGNHDIDFDAASDADALLSFRQTFGPDTFAWEEAHASFIVLDNVVYLPGQSPAYIGGLREDQFRFLENYLAGLDQQRRVVIAGHISFFDPLPGVETFRSADRARLFGLLEGFSNVLLLTAHGHVQRQYFHDLEDGWRGAAPLHEYNVGATCGSWWSGAVDADGLPDASMADGTPNGYAVLRIAPDGDYALRWYVARQPDDFGIALHAPKVLRHGAWPGVPVVANVFMGAEGDRVEVRIAGGAWRAMQRIDQPDPRQLAQNLIDDAADPLRGYDRLPQAANSTHLWRYPLPTDLAPGEHLIEVRAISSGPAGQGRRWPGELRADSRYRLDAVDR